MKFERRKFRVVTRSYFWNFLTFSNLIRSIFLQPARRAPKSVWESPCVCLSTRHLDHSKDSFWCIWIKKGNCTVFAAIFHDFSWLSSPTPFFPDFPDQWHAFSTNFHLSSPSRAEWWRSEARGTWPKCLQENYIRYSRRSLVRYSLARHVPVVRHFSPFPREAWTPSSSSGFSERCSLVRHLATRLRRCFQRHVQSRPVVMVTCSSLFFYFTRF